MLSVTETRIAVRPLLILTLAELHPMKGVVGFKIRAMTSRRRKKASQDRRELPVYTVREAAKYIGVPTSTLGSWVRGRSYPTVSGDRYFEPLISPANPDALLLSFYNLLEAHILSVTRYIHSVRIRNIRQAMEELSERYPSPHPLLTQDFHTDGKDLFISRISGIDPRHKGPQRIDRQFVNVSQYSQLGIEAILKEYLQRIDRDADDSPFQFYPVLVNHPELLADKTIAINPDISSGMPMVVSRGISAEIIVQRILAGETADDLADDYRLTTFEIQKAIEYIEKAAA